MTTTKKPYGFRLSKQAGRHLNRIVALTGTTGMHDDTVMRLAIAHLSQSLDETNNEQDVTNQYGYPLNFAAAVNFMDDEIREQLHIDLAPCSRQEFFDAYVKDHAEKYGEDWFLDDPNPVW